MGHRDRFGGRFGDVLAGARRGERWGLEQIFTALSPVVAGYLRTQGATEADDLTSEVFVAVLRNLHRFEGDEAAFRSWVFTIAHRRLTDERRRAGRQPTHEPLTAAANMAAPDQVEDAIEQSLSSDRVQRLCERLPGDQRNVLLLRLVAQLTVSEVATVLDKSPGAVRELQRRGLRSISRIIEPEGARR